MTTLLEERYRAALRLLPAPYRDRWADDMVATFLEGAYAGAPDDPEGVDISRPRVSELASIAALALRLRLGGIDAPARPRLWGDALRQAALIILFALAALSCAFFLIRVWVALRLPGTDLPLGLSGRPNQWQWLIGLLELSAVPAFVLVLYGQLRTGRAFAALALAVEVAVVGWNAAHGFGIQRTGWLLVAFWAFTVAALTAYQPTTPVRQQPRRWLVALAVTTVAVVGVSLLSADGGAPYVDWPTLGAVAVVIGWVLGRHDPSWTLAIALVSVAPLALRLATTADWLEFPLPTGERTAVLAIAAAQAVAILAVGTAAAVQTRRHWRELPDVETELSTRD